MSPTLTLRTTLPLPRKPPMRIGKLGALQKTQSNLARKHDNRKNGVRGPFVRHETDHQRLVIVVDHLDCVRQTLPHLDERPPRELRHLRREFRKE